jgi:biotin synthesis protein BioG
MTESVVAHLIPDDYDVLMFYDYNTLDSDFDFSLFKSYREKKLVAWSMGVMIASCCEQISLENFSKKVAINGTLKPIDEEFGIHPKIYDLTINGFNEKGQDKFINSMFEISPKLNIERNIENQKTELIALKNYQANTNFKYNKILISENDKIIPTKSQVKFWGIEPNLKGGHCPFLQFEKWSELL